MIETPDDLIPALLDLTTVDGNAFVIIAEVSRALRRAGNPDDVIARFQGEAMAGDYDHLLQTAIAYTTTEGESE